MLTYYHRLSKGNIQYGPYSQTVTVEKQQECSIEVFEFCHKENTSSTEFSMSNELSVGGVFKVFDFGASVSTSFAAASTSATKTGRDIKNFSKDFLSTKTETKREVPKGSFLAYYALIDMICFTVKGGKKQYLRIPRGDIVVEPMTEAELQMLSEGKFLLEKKSWSIVTDRFPNVELDDIDQLARDLIPKDIEELEDENIDPLAMMGNVYIQGRNSHKYFDGRNPQHNLVFMSGGMSNYMKWEIKKVTDGKYSFKSHSSGKYLDGGSYPVPGVEGAVRISHGNPPNDTRLQWEAIPRGKYYSLRNVSSRLYIDGRGPSQSGDDMTLAKVDRIDGYHQFDIYKC